MKKLLVAVLLASSLGGCVVYPGRAYVAPPAVVVYPHYYHY